MVSRVPEPEDADLKLRQGVRNNTAEKKLVKETHRNDNGLGTPWQSKKDGNAINKAHDVAELKDYVWKPILHLLCMESSSDTVLAIGRLPWQRGVWLSFQGTEHGYRRNRGSEASQASGSAEKRVESHYGMTLALMTDV